MLSFLNIHIFFFHYYGHWLRQNEPPFWKKSNSHWSVTITSETANLDQSGCRKINSHLEIYTNMHESSDESLLLMTGEQNRPLQIKNLRQPNHCRSSVCLQNVWSQFSHDLIIFPCMISAYREIRRRNPYPFFKGLHAFLP